MGAYTGDYSRNPLSVFDEEKNYAFALMQEGIPVTDDDANDDRLCLYTKTRRGNQLFGEYGTPNDGFRVREASSPSNNFELSGGGPGNTDIEVAGRFFIKGHSCVLLSDTDYFNDVSTIAKQSVHARVTTVYFDGSTVIEDVSANWETNEMVGRYIRIAGIDYLVASQPTSFRLTISGDQTASISEGDHYFFLLTTPSSGAREDAVYLNVYLDEYDVDDDSALAKNLGGNVVEAQLRAKVIQTLFVREDNPGFGDLTDYVDSTGLRHFVFKLATLNRPNGVANILTAYITDHVTAIGFENISNDELTNLQVVPTLAGADNKVFVRAGTCRTLDGTDFVSFPSGASPTFSVTSGPVRYDILYLTDGGSLAVFVGEEGGGVPDFPTSLGTCLAIIYINETSTVLIDDADITDIRPIVGERSDVNLAPNVNAADTTKISVLAGSALSTDGTSVVSFAGGTTAAFSVPAANPRIDVVVLEEDGTLGIIEGTEAGSPAVPAFRGTPIAFVNVTEVGGPVDIDQDDISDARMTLAPVTSPKWKWLHPDLGTIQAQLAVLGVNAGDRFWMHDGTYSLGTASLGLATADITIAGSRDAIIAMDNIAEHVEITAEGVKMEGISITHSAAPTQGTIVDVDVASGTSPELQDIAITWLGSADSTYAVRVNGALGPIISKCEINKTGNMCRGIGITDATNVGTVIRECLVNSYEYAIYTNGSDGVVTSCEFDNTSASGTYFVFDDGDGNFYNKLSMTITGSFSGGFRLDGTKTRVTDVTVHRTGTDAAIIFTNGASDITVTGIYAENCWMRINDSDRVAILNSHVEGNDDSLTPTISLDGTGSGHRIQGNYVKKAPTGSTNGPLVGVTPFASVTVTDVVITGNTFDWDNMMFCVCGGPGCDNWVVRDNNGVEGVWADASMQGGWRRNTIYSVDDVVMPNFYDYDTLGIKTISGLQFRCTTSTTPFTSDNPTWQYAGRFVTEEPIWPTEIGDTLAETNLIWTAEAVPGGICINGGDNWEVGEYAQPLVTSFIDYAASWTIGPVQAPVHTRIEVANSGGDSTLTRVNVDYDPAPETQRETNRCMGDYSGRSNFSGCTTEVSKGQYAEMYGSCSGSEGADYVVYFIPHG